MSTEHSPPKTSEVRSSAHMATVASGPLACMLFKTPTLLQARCLRGRHRRCCYCRSWGDLVRRLHCLVRPTAARRGTAHESSPHGSHHAAAFLLLRRSPPHHRVGVARPRPTISTATATTTAAAGCFYLYVPQRLLAVGGVVMAATTTTTRRGRRERRQRGGA